MDGRGSSPSLPEHMKDELTDLASFQVYFSLRPLADSTLLPVGPQGALSFIFNLICRSSPTEPTSIYYSNHMNIKLKNLLSVVSVFLLQAYQGLQNIHLVNKLSFSGFLSNTWRLQPHQCRLHEENGNIKQ